MPIDQPTYPITTEDLVEHVGSYADSVGSGSGSGITTIAEATDLDVATALVHGNVVYYDGDLEEFRGIPPVLDVLTTKGDTVGFDGSVPVRVPVGTDGQIEYADSTEPSGKRWDDAPEGGTVAASDVTFTPNGTIAATDVQAAIQEVRDEASGGGGGEAPAIWTAQQQGFKAMSFDPAGAASSAAPDSGFAFFSRLAVPNEVTLANWHTCALVVASGLTTALAFIYHEDGTLIGRTASLTGAFSGTGLITAALTVEAGESLTVGGTPTSFIHAAVLFAGGTSPTLPHPGGLAILQSVNLAVPRGGYAGGGLTAPPSPRPAIGADNRIFWMAVS